MRFSLCCAAEGCRKRETPGSLRFLGRKVFLGAMVVLISAMQQGVTPMRAKQLQALVGVSRRTVARWRQWWCRVFTESPFWRAQRALAPGASTADLPASLLQCFDGTIERQLLFPLALPRPDHDGARAFAGNLRGSSRSAKEADRKARSRALRCALTE